MIVCIDCGHGLTTKGKQCLDGTKEWVQRCYQVISAGADVGR